MKQFSMLSAVIAGLALALAGCGGDDSTSGSSSSVLTSSPTASSGGATDVPLKSGPGSCEVTVSGGITLSYKGQGGASAVGSDYWLSDDEIRAALVQINNLGSNATGAEKQKAVDDAMKKDPRIYLLIVNCISGSGDAKNSLSLLPSNASKYADLPFKPGEYVIPKGGLLAGADKPGQFSVLLSLAKTAYKVSEDGKLSITKFDKTGIAGTFSFKGEEGLPSSGTAKTINVSGKFDFPCNSGSNCKK